VKHGFQSLAGLAREKIGYLVAVVFPLFILYNALFRPWLVHPERAFFFGAIIAMTIFLVPLKSKGVVRGTVLSIIDSVLIVAVIASAVHIFLDWENITLYLGAPRTIDIALGIVAIVVTLEATRRTMFPLVPITILFLLYAVYGQVGGLLGAPTFNLGRFIQLVYLQTEGLYGLVLNVALKYIIPFLIMGSILKVMGTMDVLADLVNAFVGRTIGGPAKIAVVTSSMFGTMSGSSVANVAFTGTFTIPMMKKYGYKSEFAGGVEATASTGGHLMPPIMGTAAFLMADYTGVPYVRIMLAAILPAILYYVALFLRVHFKAKQEGLSKPSEDIIGRIASVKELIPRLIPIVMAFAVLIVGLFTWTPTRAAIVTTGALLPLSFLRRETWLTPKKILDGLVDATRSFLPIGAALIAIGVIMAVATGTGIGLKFSDLMLIAAGESLLLLLLVTAAAAIIMGMGIGGTAVYIFVAIMLGPALVKLGVPILPAHLFIFYYSALQSITPPVCLTAYTAASIAGANPIKTALHAVSLGAVGFVVAFLFVWHPELLLMGSTASNLVTFSFMAIGTASLTFALGGYINRQLSLWERFLFVILAGVFFIQWSYAISLAAVAMTGALIFIPTILKRRSQTLPKED